MVGPLDINSTQIRTGFKGSTVPTSFKDLPIIMRASGKVNEPDKLFDCRFNNVLSENQLGRRNSNFRTRMFYSVVTGYLKR